MKSFFALIAAICTATLWSSEVPVANDTVIDLQDKMTITKIKLAKPAAEAARLRGE